jgi:hypothetical protein
MRKEPLNLSPRFGIILLCVSSVLGCSGAINKGGGGQSEDPGGAGSGGGSGGDAGKANQGTPVGGASGAPGGQLVAGGALRRLAVREIESTLNTLFPELTASRPHFPPDGYALFDNDEKHLDNGLAFLENAALVMSATVDQARANPKLWTRVRTCATTDDANTCMGRFYDEWSPRLLRRPGTADERKAYLGIAAMSSDLGGIDDVLTVGLESLLRQPEFTHRVELGEGQAQQRVLTQRELLGRLAFFLWGEAPDDALIKAAAGKDLTDVGVRGAIAQTMLTNARAERQALDYHAQWLGYSTMARTGLGLEMWNESAALVRKVVFEANVNYEQLLLSDKSYLTPALAKHYQLPAVTAEGWVSYPAQSGRLGILGHGSFLSAFSNVGDTSPVKRGKNVLNRLLCTPMELPPDLKVNVDVKPAETECRIDFFRKVHSASGSCKGCHQSLDGIGFGLDNAPPSKANRIANLMARVNLMALRFKGPRA